MEEKTTKTARQGLQPVIDKIKSFEQNVGSFEADGRFIVHLGEVTKFISDLKAVIAEEILLDMKDDMITFIQKKMGE